MTSVYTIATNWILCFYWRKPAEISHWVRIFLGTKTLNWTSVLYQHTRCRSRWLLIAMSEENGVKWLYPGAVNKGNSHERHEQRIISRQRLHFWLGVWASDRVVCPWLSIWPVHRYQTKIQPRLSLFVFLLFLFGHYWSCI